MSPLWCRQQARPFIEQALAAAKKAGGGISRSGPVVHRNQSHFDHAPASMDSRRATVARPNGKLALIGYGSDPQCGQERQNSRLWALDAHCAEERQCAKRRRKLYKTNRLTEVQCAPFYPAVLIGGILRDLIDIVVTPAIYENTLFYALYHDPVFWRRVPTRRAVFRALRRGSSAAYLQHGNHRGALFHRSDGPASQAIERGPAVSRSARPKAMYGPPRLQVECFERHTRSAPMYPAPALWTP